MLTTGRRHVCGIFTRRSFGNTNGVPQERQTQRKLTELSERRKAFESKYADKLHERVKREGVASVEELKIKVTPPKRPSEPVVPGHNDHKRGETHKKSFDTLVRKDSSPVKPLGDFMDLEKILAKKHTAEEVSTLWTAYHATRSRGTGRGYISATIPLATYLKMSTLAAKYSSFLLPLPRPSPDPSIPDPAHEFHFLQWGFHEAPPHPSHMPSLPFEDPPPPAPVSAPPNPACSTVLFTPLQEYKLRHTFAQPHLVLTHYTDLATTHGIVLMRGELTPSPSSPEKFLLTQADAQLLAMGVQRFYLAAGDESSARRAELLRRFHETPADFRWEDLLAFADPTA